MNALAPGDKFAKGGCLCGAVTFRITLPTLFCGHCHCSMCRKAHGAGYITWIGVLLSHFELRQGAQKLKEYASSTHGKRGFCLELANIDDKIDRVPEAHYYFSDRADWVMIYDRLPKFGGETGTRPLQEEH